MAGRVFQDVMAGRLPGRSRPAAVERTPTQSSDIRPALSDVAPPLPATPAEELEPPLARPTTPHRSRPDPRRTLRTATRADSVQSRFQSLFATALSTKLTPRESAQFLDRFRYVVCTSNLLGERMAPIGVEARQRRRRGDGRRRDGMLDGGAEDQTLWESRRVAKHWMGSGGCVLLVSLLVTWALQTTGKGGLIESKPRQTATLVVAMLTALYLYAQTRKAQTRLHYGQSIAGLESLVDHCHDFDTLACRIVQLVQEVELVARGYHIDGGSSATGGAARLPPISRLERHSEHRRCEALRKAVSSALNMALAATERCFLAVMHVTQARDFYKLADVYNVIVNDEGDDVAIMCDEHESIAGLRALLNRVHARRRCLLCALLAVQADGRPGNARAWSVVAQQIRALCALYGSMARTLADTLEEDAKPLDLNQLVGAAQRHDPVREKTRRHLQGVNQVGTALRRAQAKMCLIRDDSVRLIGESEDDARAQLLSRYDSLGTDLETLLAEWREGKAWLDRAVVSQAQSASQIAESAELRSDLRADELGEDVLDEVDTGSVRVRPDSLGFWGPRMSIGNFDELRGGSVVPGHVPGGVLASPIEEVYEDSASGRGHAPANTSAAAAAAQGGAMSRADRIALMRKERELKQARTAQRQQEQRDRQNVVGELKDVLGYRQQQQQQQSLARAASLRMPPPASAPAATLTTSNHRASMSVASQQAPGVHAGANSLQALRRPMGLRLSIHNPSRLSPSSASVPQTPDMLGRSYMPGSSASGGGIAATGAMSLPTHIESAASVRGLRDTTTAQQMAALMQESILSPPLDNGDRKVSTRSDTTAATWDSALGGSLVDGQLPRPQTPRQNPAIGAAASTGGAEAAMKMQLQMQAQLQLQMQMQMQQRLHSAGSSGAGAGAGAGKHRQASRESYGRF